MPEPTTTPTELAEISAELEYIHRDMQKQVQQLRELRELMFAASLFIPKRAN